ncbi:MAG: glycosyltransferase family 39 protein [Isosphaeraceae bacterium]|nr:glycosyltransferase family 39 protein [Isosphaeraceae bacterium]
MILAVASLLLFWSLDGRYLWQDEAETALLAKSILRHGVPIAFDGKNVVSQEASKEFVAGSRLPYFLWRWSPWVQFYVTAGSFALFGANTLAARLPFAFLGLGSVYLTYVLAKRLFASLAVARLSALYLATSVPFLLHSRQARWCAPAYCLFIGLLLFLEGMASGRRRARTGFIVTGVLLFYTNYFVSIGLLAAVLVVAPLLRASRAFLGRLPAVYAAIALFVLPGISLFQVFNKSKPFDDNRYFTYLTYYSSAYSTFLLPLPIFVLLCGLLIVAQPVPESATGGKRGLLFLIAITVLDLGYLALAPWVEFRYMTVLLPVAAILLAVATLWILRTSLVMGILLTVVLLATDILHMDPFGYLGTFGSEKADRFPSVGPTSFPFLGFLYEVTHHFDAPEYVLSRYLNRHARTTDVVVTTYDDLPLQFYTRIRVAGGLEGRQLPEAPDWLIRRRWIMSDEPGKDRSVARHIEDLRLSNKYEPVLIVTPDHMLGTNPDPRHHFFKGPSSSPPVIMFRKMNNVED